jgi:hypothetical protein
MKTFRTTLSFFIIFASIYGCSGIKVSQDYDTTKNLSGLKTYSWKTEKQKKTGNVRIDNTLLDSRIRSAVDSTLQGKNFQKTSKSSPDFHIEYQYSIRSKIKSSNSQTGIGIGIGSFSHRGAISFSSGTNISEYDEGLLVIDITDPETGNLLWRGNATSIINQHVTPEKATKRITTIIEKILKQFPPNENK